MPQVIASVLRERSGHSFVWSSHWSAQHWRFGWSAFSAEAIAMPRRIQRKRTKGWRMPANTVYVGRPTKWGNPYNSQKMGIEQSVKAFRLAIEEVSWSNHVEKSSIRVKALAQSVWGRQGSGLGHGVLTREQKLRPSRCICISHLRD